MSPPREAPNQTCARPVESRVTGTPEPRAAVWVGLQRTQGGGAARTWGSRAKGAAEMKRWTWLKADSGRVLVTQI